MKTTIINKISESLAMTVVVAGLFCSCEDAYDVTVPEFEVKLQEGEYYEGDAVRFEITGNADLVSFFSGEVGHDMDYYGCDRYTGVGELIATFKSIFYDSTPNAPTTGFGNSTMSPIDENGKLRARMMVSTDFSGEKGIGFYHGLTDREGYSKEAIQAATWIDVSDRFQWGTTVKRSDTDGDTDSGYGNLTDLVVDGRPMYIAFVLNMPAFEGTRDTKRLRFSIFEFRFKAYPEEGNPIEIFTHALKDDFLAAHFGPFPMKGDGVTPNTSRLNIFGGARGQIYFNSPADQPITEPYQMWAISKPINVPSEKINIGPDWGLPIKAFHEPTLTGHSHIYEKAGTYKAVFLATNANSKEQYNITREVTVTIKKRP